MEDIIHKIVNVNNINFHIAEKGKKGHPFILFLHGFPELWYSWRHQILALSSKGYHAVAPDLRGYGDSECPGSSRSYTCFDIVGDLVGLIDHFGEEKVFVVGHDWGAIVGWYLCLFRPDRVKAFVCLSVPFRPRNPKIKPLESMRALFGDDYYICRFQEPGEIEGEIAHAGTAQVLKKIFTDKKPGPPFLPKQNPFGICQNNTMSLPSWLTETDIAYYVTKFNQTGFTGPLNYYRAMDLNWELTAPWTGAQVKVPVKFVVGEVDCVYTTPGIKRFIEGDEFRQHVPLLEDITVMKGVGHFIHQEKPEEINALISEFFGNY
ncbi:alpha/beta-Hydrolases superfamily protein [Euphorbia peplus]|nr:alpha/beta-Hydrolases superfamily protein [Euphorbia peplus]